MVRAIDTLIKKAPDKVGISVSANIAFVVPELENKAPSKMKKPAIQAVVVNDNMRVPMAVPKTLLKLFRPKDQPKNKHPNKNKYVIVRVLPK